MEQHDENLGFLTVEIRELKPGQKAGLPGIAHLTSRVRYRLRFVFDNARVEAAPPRR
jgi:hypothetical protein